MTQLREHKNWFTVGRIAQYCLVTSVTVRRWIEKGELSAIRLPSGHYRVSIADFRDFLERYNMPINAFSALGKTLEARWNGKKGTQYVMSGAYTSTGLTGVCCLAGVGEN